MLNYFLICILFIISCTKVDLTKAKDDFKLLNASYFEAEKTLFIFWDYRSEKKIHKEMTIEINYQNDNTWIPVTKVKNVHTHLPVNCTEYGNCGSVSIYLNQLLLNAIKIRIKYFNNGNIIKEIPIFTNYIANNSFSPLSIFVYGIFYNNNQKVEWRYKHEIPNLTNDEVEYYGLRRKIKINNYSVGSFSENLLNPKNYFTNSFGKCPDTFTKISYKDTDLEKRRARASLILDNIYENESAVCADVNINIGENIIKKTAIAYKNPIVKSANLIIKSNNKEAQLVPYIIANCTNNNESNFLSFQKIQLNINDDINFCYEKYSTMELVPALIADITLQANKYKNQKNDIVFKIILNNNNETESLQIGYALAEALNKIILNEESFSTPRIVGAFVYDAYAKEFVNNSINKSVLWCPIIKKNQIKSMADLAKTSCSITPINQKFAGDFLHIEVIPPMPSLYAFKSNSAYNSSIPPTKLRSIEAVVPNKDASTSIIHFEDNQNIAIFSDKNMISINKNDRFSYCHKTNVINPFVYKYSNNNKAKLLSELPLEQITNPQTTWNIGLMAEGPFYLFAEYEILQNLGISVLGAKVGYNKVYTSNDLLGDLIWTNTDFSINNVLNICTKFCNHSFFEASGAYNYMSSFETAFSNACYSPNIPVNNVSDNEEERDPYEP